MFTKWGEHLVIIWLIFLEWITTPNVDDEYGGGGGDSDNDDINKNDHLLCAYQVSGIVLSTILALIHLIVKEL